MPFILPLFSRAAERDDPVTLEEYMGIWVKMVRKMPQFSLEIEPLPGVKALTLIASGGWFLLLAAKEGGRYQ